MSGGAGYLPFGKVFFQFFTVPAASLPWQVTQFFSKTLLPNATSCACASPPSKQLDNNNAPDNNNILFILFTFFKLTFNIFCNTTKNPNDLENIVYFLFRNFSAVCFKNNCSEYYKMC
ncbi:hypothetical protein MNB_SUP05-SYMBIONT-5-1252 [hydrothermal vent metagenome]|uniref:Uncharacterized protein n=1 Tax=hydrothermal vent metagenome TaxID=652676 RepID=A0A1W1E4Q4_9ZZZZ